jgi:hypothetical protein
VVRAGLRIFTSCLAVLAALDVFALVAHQPCPSYPRVGCGHGASGGLFGTPSRFPKPTRSSRTTSRASWVAILGRSRKRISAITTDQTGERPDLSTAARAAWTWSSNPQRWAEFRLFFAVYGRALQAPHLFDDFLEHVMSDWMDALRDPQGPGADPTAATLVIATIRGLLLDLLTTGDRDRIQNAAETFLASLERTGSTAIGAGTRDSTVPRAR